jgi:2-(1,2-epoxy-1,2-dihydrophenyl)acetyl-CoA isomerase
MSEERITVRYEGGVARLTLDHPESANAIDLAFATQFEAAAQTIVSQRARVVLITATGKQFCVGGDLKSFAQSDDLAATLAEVTTRLHAGIATLVDYDAPVVVAVHGAVAGAGFGLVMAADIAIAAEGSSFLMAYTKIGLTPDGATSWYLPRIVGLRRALDLTLMNRSLSAREALEWGLVSRVVDEDAEGAAEALAIELASGPTGAYGAAARLLRTSADATLVEHLAKESAQMTARARTHDGPEGVASFLERRAGDFVGD